jgi:hypothetical protein
LIDHVQLYVFVERTDFKSIKDGGRKKLRGELLLSPHLLLKTH